MYQFQIETLNVFKNDQTHFIKSEHKVSKESTNASLGQPQQHASLCIEK